MKRTISLLLTLIIALGVVTSFPITTSAASVSDLRFELNDDGASYRVASFVRYKSGELVIPSAYNGKPVTKIDNWVFSDCASLTSVTIPNTVKSIGKNAFYNCTGLVSVVMPNNITEIEYQTFYGCTSLASITIPDSVTNIGLYAFFDCTSLTSIVIPDSVTSIEAHAFVGCTSLASITLPDNDISIGLYVFEDTAYYNNPSNWVDDALYLNNHLINTNRSLTGEYIVEYGTKTIGAGAFYFCENLVSVIIPDTVVSIGEQAFYECKSLTSVSVPDTITCLDRVFQHCSALKTIMIPETVTSINGAFRNCTRLTSIKIPDSVTSMEDAFYGCSSLTSVTLPDGITGIDKYAFQGCRSLQNITIPDSVTSIGNSAFYRCSNLTTITIPKNVTDIGSSAFYECYRLTTITIPDGVTHIGGYAFFRCEKLTDVTLSDSVTYIGDSAFYRCPSLKYVFCTDEAFLWYEKNVYPDNEELFDAKWHYGVTNHTLTDWIYDCQPTCSSAGLKHKECSICGDVIESQDIPMLVHPLTDWIIDKAPTCTEDGCKIRKCVYGCPTIVQEAIPAAGHTGGEWVIEFEETCITPGYKYKECLVCGELAEEEIIPELGHSPTDWIIDEEASCTTSGCKHKECLVCGEVIEYKSIPEFGHSPSNWIIDEQANCKTNGHKHKECLTCGITLSTETIFATGNHIESGWITDIVPTCTGKGSRHTECTVCGIVMNTGVIVEKPHQTQWFDISKPTCLNTGKRIKKCTLCGTEFEIETTPATGHISSDWVVDTEATCTINGAKHTECTVCGVTINTQTIIANGHTEVKTHSVAPTCTTTGLGEGSHCSVCNTVIVAQITIPAKGHTSSAWIIEKQANCETDGSKYRQCTVCGEVIERVAIPATGHTPSGWITNPQTSTQYKECTVCKQVIETQSVPVNAPTITSCYNEVEGVQLKWTAVANAAEYELYRKLPSQSGWTLLTTTSDLAYRDVDVTGNSVYQYSLKTIDVYGNKSGLSAQRECRFLETPTLLTRENAVGGVKITWEKVEGATSYRIYRRGAGTDYWFYLGDFPATLNTFTDLETANYFPENPTKNQQAKPKSGNYYRYTIRASYDGEDSNGNPYLIYSGFDTVGLYLKYVATPKLTSISNATNGLQIKWNAVNGGGDTEYRVYRRGAGATYWYYLGTTTGTTWTDTKIANANGSYYRYTVRAVAGKDGSGWYSAFDTAGLYLMRLSNPTLNSAVSSSAGITVKWGSVKGATSYYVYRKTANSGWTRIATVSGNTNTTYLDKTAQKGVTYTYTVRAVYGATLSYFNSGISCYDKY